MKVVYAKYKLELAGLALGAVAGWMYWYFVGCASGTCAITSSSVNSSLYGAFTGGVLLSLFKTDIKQQQHK